MIEVLVWFNLKSPLGNCSIIFTVLSIPWGSDNKCLWTPVLWPPTLLWVLRDSRLKTAVPSSEGFTSTWANNRSPQEIQWQGQQWHNSSQCHRRNEVNCQECVTEDQCGRTDKYTKIHCGSCLVYRLRLNMLSTKQTFQVSSGKCFRKTSTLFSSPWLHP